MNQVKTGFRNFHGWVRDFDPEKLTISSAVGLIAALCMLIFICSMNWNWGILSILATILILIITYVYGAVIARLVEETTWLSEDQSLLSRSVIIWGWAGVALGLIMMVFTVSDLAPFYIRIVTFMVWTGIVWGGPVFPIKVLTLTNEPEAPDHNEHA